MSKLPRTLLQLNLNHASTSLISVGLGLALLGLNAKAVSATPVDAPDDPDTDGIDGNLIDENLANDPEAALASSAIPTLVDLQTQASEAIAPVLPVQTAATPATPLRFRLPPESDSISEADEAALIAQMAEPGSALSQVPSPTAQTAFDASLTYQPPQPESESIDLVSPLRSPSTSLADGVEAEDLQPERDSAEMFSSASALPPLSATIETSAIEIDESRNEGAVPIDIVVEPFEPAKSSETLLAGDWTAEFTSNFTSDVVLASTATESTAESSDTPSAIFAIQPPISDRQLSPEAIAYRPDFTAPTHSTPAQSSTSHAPMGTALPLLAQVPMAALHPALPMASLDAGMPQELSGAVPYLVAVPANPPSGRSSSRTLPPPPSLPSIVSGAETPESQLITGLSTEGDRAALPRLDSSPQVVIPIPVTSEFEAVSRLPSPSYAAVIPIPESAPWNQADLNSSQFSGGLAPTAWSPPELVALEIVWQAAVQSTAPAWNSSPSPGERVPNLAPTDAWNRPNVPSALQRSSNGAAHSLPGASFNPSDPFSPPVPLTSPLLYQSSTPSPTLIAGRASSWESATSAAVPMPIATSLPWGQSAPNASLPLESGYSAPWMMPQAAAAAPATFSPDDSFETPLQTVPSSWMTTPLVGQTFGQTGQPQPVIIPGEPTQPPIFGQQGQPEQPTTSPSPSLLSDLEEPEFGRTPVTQPFLQFQGGFILVDDDASARARLTGIYPFTPQIFVGGTVDLTEGQDFSDSETEGLSINELYIAASLRDLPNLRFVVGQIDLTSYFDRNSFAKDSLTHFFNPVFQTNPALASSSIGSRPGALINFSPTDNFEVRAAAFSSDRAIGDFALDGFAGELGYRVGNLILRGTYVSARDGGTNDGPAEIFGFDRGDDVFGIEEGDREEAFGFNAEYFIPEANLGLFARYGRYENLDADFVGDTFSAGLNVLDVFMPNDRIGLGYGRALSNDDLRQELDGKTPDVLEVFYDFPILDNFRLGFTLQQRDEFSETVAGFRVRTTFDIFPR